MATQERGLDMDAGTRMTQQIIDACCAARAKQHAFLEHVGLTLDELKSWGDCPARHTIDRMYDAFVWPRD